MQRAFGFTFNVLTGAPAPGATVTVFNTGTSNLSTIFSDNLSTPKANPFTSDGSTAYWFFYASGSVNYDIQISGTGITTYTLGDYTLTPGLTTLNGLTGANQTFATGTAGTDFAISSVGTTHTFNIPSASATNRGLVTTGAQTFAGTKTFSTPIAVGSGGTGLATSPTNGQLLIGNGSTYTLNTITGTANQISVAVGAGTTTLSTPQNINTTSSPTFVNETLTGGLNVGFTGALTAAAINVGDASFTVNFNTGNPQIAFDVNDALRYTRATNLWQWFIGAVEQASLNTAGLILANGLIVGFAGTPTADQVQVGDANFRMDFNAGTPILNFNAAAGDLMVCDRAAHNLQFNTSGVLRAVIDSTGVQILKGLIVGFAGAAGDDEVQVGDANFKLDWFSSTDVRLQLDTGVYINSDRGTSPTNIRFKITSLPGDDIASQVTTFGFSGLKGADVTAAAAIVPTGNVFHVVGNTNITSITSTNIPAATVITIIFDGTPTFTDGGNLKLAGNLVATADDTITLAYDGTNWYEMARSVN